MDHIDVHDLPEEDARVIAAFVEFLRRRTQEHAVREAEAQERDWAAGAGVGCFLDPDGRVRQPVDAGKSQSLRERLIACPVGLAAVTAYPGETSAKKERRSFRWTGTLRQ